MLQRLFDAIRKFWEGVTEFVVAVYVTLILNGAKKFADVPALIKPQVQLMLEQLGIPELAA